MAKFFKYRAVEELAAAAEELGERLNLSTDLAPLFRPVNIGSKQAGNRFAIQPMEGCDGTPDGHPDELTYRRYRRFGAGGAKIIWGEATAIEEAARMNPRQLWLNEQTAGNIERMLKECRAEHRAAWETTGDLVVGLQLTHSGRFSYRRPLIAVHDPILDPRTVDKSTGKIVDADYPLLSDDDLKRIEDQYVETAKLAAKIGVDFIDIKQCHRYLLSELLAARQRPGDYGGSYENRTRLIRNVVTRIRHEVPSLVVATRMNVYDGIPYEMGPDRTGVPCRHTLPLEAAWGTDPNDHLRADLTEPLQLAKDLAEWGVSMINVSMGNPYANPHLVRPAEMAPVDGYDAPEHPLIGVLRHFRLAAKIQAAVPQIPVVGSGYSWLQDYLLHAAAGNVQFNRISIVGVGRATLSQPDFVRQVLEHGQLERKRVCRTFSYCTNLMRSKDHPLGQYPTGCPPFDKEVYQPLWKEAEAKLKGKD